jgi:beta-glucosidase/6-phospho-beta-glucosidase/beta-galactosidase
MSAWRTSRLPTEQGRVSGYPDLEHTMRDMMFGSLFMAGFECSTKQYWDGRRLDLLTSTRHFELCERDYEQCLRHGLTAARDGFRWNQISPKPGIYDWSSIRPMLQASRRTGMTVIWDLCHYGYPDWLNFWSDYFVEEFARYTTEAVKLIKAETGRRPMICPMNEVSFWAWLGGKEGKMTPAVVERGSDVKRQLIRAKLASIAAARAVDPDTVVICAEPLINMVTDSHEPEDEDAARAYHEAQYETVDHLLGRACPELGGHAGTIDVIGINYYPHNQWRIRGGFIPLGHCCYKPLSELLVEVWDRYRKPLFIAETGCEKSARAAWMHYIGQEVRAAMAAGVPIHGICLYPITDYEGWDNGRLCETGLFSLPDERGIRKVHTPLHDELKRQKTLFEQAPGALFSWAA